MRYNWLIEVRTMAEKYQLRSQIYRLRKELRLWRTAKVPHLTLVYDFAPRVNAYKIAQIVQKTAKRYKKLEFSYAGWDLKKGPGGYVFGFKIEPSRELREFRYDLYQNLRPLILENQHQTENFNIKSIDDFWFHASIAYHLDWNTGERINKFIHSNSREDKQETKSIFNILNVFRSGRRNTVVPYASEAEVTRIPILRSGRITYEYDFVLGRILNRREALSRRFFEMDKHAT